MILRLLTLLAAALAAVPALAQDKKSSPLPGHLPLELPDLASRLASCTRFALKPLGDAERRDVLKARAAQRGFELDDAVLEFLFRRYPRDLGALLELLERLDHESLAQQRRVTVPFLRRIMGLPSRQ